MNEKNKKLLHIIKRVKEKHSDDNMVLVIPHFMSKSFTSFCSMREDLLIIKKYLERLFKEQDDIIQSALMYSSISLYGKCFTDATENKAPKLEPLQLFKDHIEIFNTHKYLMELRHKFISHRGNTAGEVEVSYLLVPNEREDAQVRYHRLKQISFDLNMQKKIKTLINFILESLERKIQKSGQKTYSAFIKNFTPEEMKFMIINNLK
jgi:hypothetical protein